MLRKRVFEIKTEDHLTKAFLQLDKDNNQKITFGHFKKVFFTCGEKLSDEEMKELFGKKKKDEDLIDFNEFKKMCLCL